MRDRLLEDMQRWLAKRGVQVEKAGAAGEGEDERQ